MDDADPPEDAAAGEPPDFDGDPPTPLELLADASDPLRATLRQGTQVFGLPEPAVLAGDVLATPADERFARCARRYAEQFGDGAALSDPERLSRMVAQLPAEQPIARTVRVVARVTGQLEGELLAAAPDAPEDAEAYLALAVAARRLRELVLDLGETFEAGEGAEGDLAHLLSATLALTARLFDLAPGEAPRVEPADDEAPAAGEDADASDEPEGNDASDRDGVDRADDASREALEPEDWLDTLARDVVRAGYHREAATGDPPATVPAARSDAELRRIVRLRGAAAAVDALEVDAETAAALVGEAPAALSALLERRA
jgi:hypothetical protein